MTDVSSRDHEDHLEVALADMRQQMEDLKFDLETERGRLQRDNRRLQDLVSEINLKRTAEVDSFRSELQRLEEDAEDEIKQFKEQVDSLQEERERLTAVRHA
jgi:polyhydroxyalkanoate synthesis regulator phasin